MYDLIGDIHGHADELVQLLEILGYVGGVWGYAEYLETLAGPKHEEHDEMLQRRRPFDPEKFDTDRATKAMRRGLPDWRHYQ